MQQVKKQARSNPIGLLILSVLVYFGCTSSPTEPRLFSALEPLIVDLSNEGKWDEANRLLQINLDFDNLDQENEIRFHLILAENFRFLEEYAQTEEAYLKAAHYAKTYDNQAHLGEAFYGLGDLSYLNWSYFKRESELARSEAYLDSAHSQATQTRNDKLLSKVLYRQGTILQIQGAEEESRRHFQQGLNISFSIQDTAGIIRNHTHTAVVFRRSGDMDSALYHHQQAYEMARAINRNYSEAHALGNLGSYYLETGETEKALGYYEKAYFLATELGHGIVLCKGLLGLARVSTKQGRTSDAMQYAEAGLQLAREKGYLNFQSAFDGLIEQLNSP